MAIDSQHPFDAAFGGKSLDDIVSILRGYVEKGSRLFPDTVQQVYEQGGPAGEEITFMSTGGSEGYSRETLINLNTSARVLLTEYLRADPLNIQHSGRLLSLFAFGDWISADRGDLLRVISRVRDEKYTDEKYQQRPIRIPLINCLMESQDGCTDLEKQTLEGFWMNLFNDPEYFSLGYLGMIRLEERKAPELYPALRQKNGGEAPYNVDSWLYFEGIAKRQGMTLDYKF